MRWRTNPLIFFIFFFLLFCRWLSYGWYFLFFCLFVCLFVSQINDVRNDIVLQVYHLASEELVLLLSASVVFARFGGLCFFKDFFSLQIFIFHHHPHHHPSLLHTSLPILRNSDKRYFRFLVYFSSSFIALEINSVSDFFLIQGNKKKSGEDFEDVSLVLMYLVLACQVSGLRRFRPLLLFSCGAFRVLINSPWMLKTKEEKTECCILYTSPSPRDA